MDGIATSFIYNYSGGEERLIATDITDIPKSPDCDGSIDNGIWIYQWGSSQFISLSFSGFSSVHILDTSPPNLSRCRSMRYCFDGVVEIDADISTWDVTNVTDMKSMFRDSGFNSDISSWNVANVIDMSWMFCGSQFNGDISNWNVANVTTMTHMFSDSQFNGDISSWRAFHNSFCLKFRRELKNFRIIISPKNNRFYFLKIRTYGYFLSLRRIIQSFLILGNFNRSEN